MTGTTYVSLGGAELRKPLHDKKQQVATGFIPVGIAK